MKSLKIKIIGSGAILLLLLVFIAVTEWILNTFICSRQRLPKHPRLCYSNSGRAGIYSNALSELYQQSQS